MGMNSKGATSKRGKSIILNWPKIFEDDAIPKESKSNCSQLEELGGLIHYLLVVTKSQCPILDKNGDVINSLVYNKVEGITSLGKREGKLDWVCHT